MSTLYTCITALVFTTESFLLYSSRAIYITEDFLRTKNLMAFISLFFPFYSSFFLPYLFPYSRTVLLLPLIKSCFKYIFINFLFHYTIRPLYYKWYTHFEFIPRPFLISFAFIKLNVGGKIKIEFQHSFSRKTIKNFYKLKLFFFFHSSLAISFGKLFLLQIILMVTITFKRSFLYLKSGLIQKSRL